MKKFFCTAILVSLSFMAGCSKSENAADITSQLQNNVSGTAMFVSGMGCNNPDCTDRSHHHDCPATCEDYDHHHNCNLDCTEVSHHHTDTHHNDYPYDDATEAANDSFVSGMGCSDPDCTDSSHHHDCPATCGDYDHHHNCSLDCTEASHHHRGTGGGNESGHHYQEGHQGGNHH